MGTVGQVIGRALMPRARRKAESGRGRRVRRGMMGVGRLVGDVAGSVESGLWRCGGSERMEGSMVASSARRRWRK